MVLALAMVSELVCHAIIILIKIVKLKGHSPGDVFIEQSVIGQTLFFKGREMIQGENMTL